MRTWLESMPGVAVRLALEKAVARVVELDTVTAKRLGELDGQVLQITSTLPELTFYLRFRAEGLDILAVSEEPVSASLKGASTELFRLLLAEEPLVQLQQGHLELSGNTELLLMLAGILQEAEFDWEMLVAPSYRRCCGPCPGLCGPCWSRYFTTAGRHFYCKLTRVSAGRAASPASCGRSGSFSVGS